MSTREQLLEGFDIIEQATIKFAGIEHSPSHKALVRSNVHLECAL